MSLTNLLNASIVTLKKGYRVECVRIPQSAYPANSTACDKLSSSGIVERKDPFSPNIVSLQDHPFIEIDKLDLYSPFVIL